MSFSTDSDNAMLRRIVDGSVTHEYSFEAALDAGYSLYRGLTRTLDGDPPRIPEELWVVGVVSVRQETESGSIEWRWVR
jgi:hypothetical protein